jgi:hypothetical protein
MRWISLQSFLIYFGNDKFDKLRRVKYELFMQCKSVRIVRSGRLLKTLNYQRSNRFSCEMLLSISKKLLPLTRRLNCTC